MDRKRAHRTTNNKNGIRADIRYAKYEYIASNRKQWAKSIVQRRIRDRERTILLAEWLGLKPGRLAIGYASVKGLDLEISVSQSASLRRVPIIGASGTPHAIVSAFAVCDDEKKHYECWVAVGEKGYRTIYHDYLTQFFKLAPGEKLSSQVHVDHILSRARARSIFETGDAAFVRLMMVKSSTNIKFGLFEKHALLKDAPSMGGTGRANFTWPLLIKILGLQPPSVGCFSDHYIVGVLREISSLHCLHESYIEEPYFLMRNVFMSGSRGRGVDNTLVYRGRNGRLLSGSDTLATWLSNFDPLAEPQIIPITLDNLCSDIFN